MAMAATAAAPSMLLASRAPLWRAMWRLPCYTRSSRTHRPSPLIHSSQAPGGVRHVVVEALKGGGEGGEAPLMGLADKNVAEAVKNIVETARRASLRRSVMHTNFLTPPVVKEATMALEKLADIKAVSQGGYPQAERCRLSVGLPDVMDTIPDTVAAVRISGNFEFEPCAHGDFLGAILGTGIVREKVGDILLQGEKGAQVLVVPELVDFLVSTLGKVGNVPVSCTEIPLLALEYEPPRWIFMPLLTFTQKKPRQSNGDVRVNWCPVSKNRATLKSGDVISVSGKGRLKIGEISTTKKGKFAVELIRYL